MGSCFIKLWGFKDCQFGQITLLTRGIFRATNAEVEIYSVLDFVPNWIEVYSLVCLIPYHNQNISLCTLYSRKKSTYFPFFE